MLLNEFGELAQNEWLKTGIIRPNIVIDAFVVMPNYLHGILIINDNDEFCNRGDTLQRVSTTRQYIINNPKQWQEDNLNKFL
jgi:REP element-mobilizing transposase RayT